MKFAQPADIYHGLRRVAPPRGERGLKSKPIILKCPVDNESLPLVGSVD